MLPRRTPSNTLPSISIFTFPSLRLTCHLGSKSLPMPQVSSLRGDFSPQDILSSRYKSTNFMKCLGSARLQSTDDGGRAHPHAFNAYLSASSFLFVLQKGSPTRAAFFNLFLFTALSPETSIAPGAYEALHNYLLSCFKSSLIHLFIQQMVTEHPLSEAVQVLG